MMRMKTLIAAALIAVSPLAAAPAHAADGPVSLPQLAPGEVLLEVNAAGIVTSPASSASFRVAVRGEGADAAAARRSLQEDVDRVTAAARAAGAAAADIQVLEINAGRVSYAAADPATAYFAHGSVEIRLRNPAAAPGLYRTLAAGPNGSIATPLYELDDDSAARRQARDRALRNARADAESYAAAAGMRIVRVLRVTERMGLDAFSMAVTESNAVMRTMSNWTRSVDRPEVQTVSILGVDYVLARR